MNERVYIPPTKRRAMTKARATPDFVERVRELFHYNPHTGQLIWRVSRSAAARAGTVAGCAHHWGYRVITIDGKQYGAHRIAWLHTYGTWPNGEIDHINGDKSDNRMSNLRDCSRAENHQNRKFHRDNTSGYTGVHWRASRSKWRAQIKKDGVRHFLGDFDTPEDAHEAYLAAKVRLHPFNPVPRQGRRDG